MGICKREPTIEELLFDSMMALVFDHARVAAEDVRAIVRDVRKRLATVATYGEVQAQVGGQT